MAREISWEIRERAEELYIVDARTYDQVAEATGVSVSQLKRWSSDGGWSERKKEYCEALSDIRRKKVLLRKKLIENAYNSLDPQDVYAAARMEAAAAKAAADAATRDESGPDIDRPAVFLENLQWLAAKLKDLDPEGLKVLARNFDALIQQFKSEYAQTA